MFRLEGRRHCHDIIAGRLIVGTALEAVPDYGNRLLIGGDSRVVVELLVVLRQQVATEIAVEIAPDGVDMV